MSNRKFKRPVPRMYQFWANEQEGKMASMWRMFRRNVLRKNKMFHYAKMSRKNNTVSLIEEEEDFGCYSP